MNVPLDSVDWQVWAVFADWLEDGNLCKIKPRKARRISEVLRWWREQFGGVGLQWHYCSPRNRQGKWAHHYRDLLGGRVEDAIPQQVKTHFWLGSHLTQWQTWKFFCTLANLYPQLSKKTKPRRPPREQSSMT